MRIATPPAACVCQLQRSLPLASSVLGHKGHLAGQIRDEKVTGPPLSPAQTLLLPPPLTPAPPRTRRVPSPLISATPPQSHWHPIRHRFSTRWRQFPSALLVVLAPGGEEVLGALWRRHDRCIPRLPVGCRAAAARMSAHPDMPPTLSNHPIDCPHPPLPDTTHEPAPPDPADAARHPEPNRCSPPTGRCSICPQACRVCKPARVPADAYPLRCDVPEAR